MTEQAQLSSITVDEGGKITFSFDTAQTGTPIAGLAIPKHHDASRVADQLAALERLGALHKEHAGAVAAHTNLGELYRPGESQPVRKPEQQHEVVGAHTAEYLAQAAQTPSTGQSL